MGNWWRAILVGAIALCGFLLVILGIGGLRDLLDIGKVPPEMLGHQVGYTSWALAIGLAMIAWTLVAGINWARSRRDQERR
jgi:Na+/H+-dicarboxylate symporter